MSDDKLKLVETCALLVLLKEAQEISNADLKNLRGFELKAENRNRLRDLKLIDVRKEGQRVFLGVSDHGWRKALDVIGVDPPARSGYAGATVYGQVASLRQFLSASGIALSEFFLPRPDTEVAADTSDVAALIRKAYDSLAQTAGDSVKLARIRAELAGVDRKRIDEALIALNTQSGVRVYAEANQKTLTDADRDAAVSIGNQDKHLLAIK
jgi:hypothetical protein